MTISTKEESGIAYIIACVQSRVESQQHIICTRCILGNKTAPDFRRIGRNIAELRQAQNLTQKELAERAEISVSYLSRIEEGGCSRPHVKTISRIAFALGVKISELKIMK